MAHEFAELSAYLDGEVSEEERRRIEMRLASDAEYAREFKRLERTRSMFSEAYVEEPGFHANLMRRIQDNEPRLRGRRVEWWRAGLVAAAVLAVLIGLAVYWGAIEDSQPVPPSGRPSPTHAVVPAGSDEESADGTDGGAILLAEAIPEPTEDVASEVVLEATELPIRLVGTVTGDTPMAILTVNGADGSTQGTYEVGDTILPGVTLAEIGSRQAVIDNEGRMELLVQSAPVAVETEPDIDGVWEMTVWTGNEAEASKQNVYVKNVEGRVLLAFEAGAEPVVEGTLTGRHVHAVNTEAFGDDLDVAGDFDADWNELTAEGTMTYLVGHEEEERVSKLKCHLVKLPERDALADMAVQLALKRCKAEFDDMVANLKSYAEDHEGRFPGALDELVPEYAEDIDAFQTTDVRTVEYFPGKSLVAIAREKAVGPWEAFHPTLPMSDRLILLEETLQRVMGNVLFQSDPVLGVAYAEAKVKFSFNTLGATGMVDPTSTGTQEGYVAGTAEAAARLAAMRASCANNLKQLGLVVKLFENDYDGYTPAGWLSTYPEYCSDPGILTSPKDAPGTDSYLYLFPATNIADMLRESMENPADFETVPGARDMAESQVPIVLNKTDLPGPIPGRNVLFADGHVEYLRTDLGTDPDTPDRWRDLVLPYLKEN